METKHEFEFGKSGGGYGFQVKPDVQCNSLLSDRSGCGRARCLKSTDERSQRTVRVYVTNITSDEVQLMYGFEFHKVICDCTIEHYTEHTEKQTCRIFSPPEYRSVMENGYYLIPDDDTE